MGWRGLLLCLLLVGVVTSERIVSRTGLILSNKTVVDRDGKEVSYLNEYVLSKIGEFAPYLLVENGTLQLSNLVDAYYQLYKYAADGTTTLTYQTRVRDERGYTQLVTKEAIFGVHFHLTFQVPPPANLQSSNSETLKSEPSEKSENEKNEKSEKSEEIEKSGESEKKENNEEKKENNDKKESNEEKSVEVVETKKEEENNNENNNSNDNVDSITTELTIFQDIKGLLSISSCFSYKTNNKNSDNNKEEEKEEQKEEEKTEEKEEEKKGDGKLKILSYNIWNYNSPWKLRHQMIADEVDKILPDIIAWQEVRYSKWDRMEMQRQTKEQRWGGARFQVEQLGNALLERELKYHFVYHPAMVYIHNLPDYEIEGLSFFSKYPILESNFVSLSRDISNHRDEHQRICARALIETPHGRVNVFVTHMSLDEEAQERNAQEILKFADQYDYPQVLMGDFNCLPDTVAIEFLTGAREIDGKRGNFVDAWVDYTSRIESQCDAQGECRRPCTRTTQNATCWEDDGYTFNALDEAPRKRIDFVLLRGASVDDVAFVGNEPREDSEHARVMASDHFGMLANLRINNNNNNNNNNGNDNKNVNDDAGSS